jgi:hypothetical protein
MFYHYYNLFYGYFAHPRFSRENYKEHQNKTHFAALNKLSTRKQKTIRYWSNCLKILHYQINIIIHCK